MQFFLCRTFYHIYLGCPPKWPFGLTHSGKKLLLLSCILNEVINNSEILVAQAFGTHQTIDMMGQSTERNGRVAFGGCNKGRAKKKLINSDG